MGQNYEHLAIASRQLADKILPVYDSARSVEDFVVKITREFPNVDLRIISDSPVR